MGPVRWSDIKVDSEVPCYVTNLPDPLRILERASKLSHELDMGAKRHPTVVQHSGKKQ